MKNNIEGNLYLLPARPARTKIIPHAFTDNDDYIKTQTFIVDIPEQLFNQTVEHEAGIITVNRKRLIVITVSKDRGSKSTDENRRCREVIQEIVSNDFIIWFLGDENFLNSFSDNLFKSNDELSNIAYVKINSSLGSFSYKKEYPLPENLCFFSLRKQVSGIDIYHIEPILNL